ncbi:menaquinone biosynthesis decarboxylase, partial [Candidatus Geothermarchaeota archaeon]
GKAIERIFLPFLKMIFPEIVDINLPIHGLFHGLAVVSIKKRYPGHAKKVMLGLWGLGQFSLNKILIVVDSDVDIHDLNQVVYAISSTVDPKRDVVIIPYTHTDALDHTVSTPLIGSKMGIDATRKYREELGREWPKEIEGYPDDVMRKIEDIVSRLRK